ncbi:MAG: hydrolase [Bacteroidetes bacterium]|nr:hydrolase [Bacteroidota bacterium]
MLKTFGRLPNGKEWTRIKRSPNFNGRTFENPIPTKLSMNPFRVMREYAKSDPLRRKPPHPIPLSPIYPDDLNKTPSVGLKITWLGHASIMMEVGGIRLLCDPVFSERVSPFGFAGPKRHHVSPIRMEDLPNIDAVLISHNHYDHLDHELIGFLKDKDIRFITPLAVGASLRYWGVRPELIHELDWHEFVDISGVKIVATPARHFTNRGLLDRNKSFWASFVIESRSEKAFFCGDSGFFPGFKEIGEQYGPLDVTMIGIGAYNKDWQAIHTNPEEAVEAHQLLKGKYLLPIHWCTFDLALHDWSEPVERLIKEAESKGVELLIPKPGESVIPKNGFKNEHWW